MFTLGRGSGMHRAHVAKTVETSLPAIAGILLIVSAGGGFKQALVDTGIGTQLAHWAQAAHVSVLLLAWLLAVLIRLATGSATGSPPARRPSSCWPWVRARCSSPT